MQSEPSTSIEALSALFPLTVPTPTPLTHPELIQSNDLQREEDLLRNPDSLRLWWTVISAVRESILASQKSEPGSDYPEEAAQLLGPLASPAARRGLQRLTFLYESSLVHFPSSFKLWKAYLQVRCSYVLGKLIRRKRAGGRKKFADMKDSMEEEQLDLENWEGGLDPVVGWEEWKALVATFERALMWCPTMPRLWLLYLSIFNHPLCPAQITHTHARRTFDRALRTLTPSLHSRIWPRYLIWASSKRGATTFKVYRRYLEIDPSITEHYTSLLLDPSNPTPRPLEAAKLLLVLARKAARGEYVSPEGKSPYQLVGEWLDVVEKYADEVGLDIEQTDARAAVAAKEKAEKAKLVDETVKAPPASSTGGPLMRFGGPPTAVNPTKVYDVDEDPSNSTKLDIPKIVHEDGLEIYKDQAGRLWTGLATYWAKRGEFDRAKETFEAGIASVLTIRDFTQIFDSYAEFSESLLSAMMDGLQDPDADDDDEAELDKAMKDFEELMDRRPFLSNEVLLRRNPHDVQEWEKRVALWGTNDEKIVETYTKAIETINPRRATANCFRIYVNFAKFYEEGGSTGEAEKDLASARKILEKAVKVNFKTVEDLAEVWSEWAEMELRNDNYEEAIRVMQRAATIPKNTKINYHDQSLPVQARLFKSLKLWSFYVDLEESLGTVDTTKAVYDKILELRIANAQVIVNYAAFLEENKYFEESFKVYERGVELFTFPIAFELWNIYLSKFVKRYGGSKIERARDLFEQALEKCPEKSCKPLFLMYGQLEEEHGLAKRAMNIYERATQVVTDNDKFEMFTIYIAKVTANFGLPATRPIYQRALEVLPNNQAASMCLRFAALERKLGEIDRARAIYAHASQFCDPRVAAKFWQEWNTFEIETGSEDSFREMLRIKRSVQASFNTEVSYLSAQATAARAGNATKIEVSGAPVDAMAAAEKAAGVAGKGPAFVAATQRTGTKEDAEAGQASPVAQQANVDEIQIDDDDF